MTPKQWRKQTNMTIKAVAEKLGCSESMVSLIETGQRVPSFDLLSKYIRLSDGQITLEGFQKTEGSHVPFLSDAPLKEQ